MERTEAALVAFAGAWVAFVALALVLPHTTPMLVVKQIACIGAPAIAFAVWRGGGLVDGLGLRRPQPLAWLGAALIGASFWYLNMWLTIPLLEWLGLARAIDIANRSAPWLDTPIAVRIAAIAIVPAVCEELLLRGVVARSLASSHGVVLAVLVSTALFAAFHLPPVRMVPVGLFGIALGFAAVATDAVLPAMLMHFLNNLIAAAPEVIPGQLIDTIEANPDAAGALAMAATCAGAGLLWRSRPDHEL